MNRFFFLALTQSVSILVLHALMINDHWSPKNTHKFASANLYHYRLAAFCMYVSFYLFRASTVKHFPFPLFHACFFCFLGSPNLHYEHLCTHQTMKYQMRTLYACQTSFHCTLFTLLVLKCASCCWKWWRTNAELSDFFHPRSIFLHYEMLIHFLHALTYVQLHT